MRRWLALVLAGAMLFLSSWIFLPAPTYFLLTFGVGAPEVSAWLIVGSIIALLLARRSFHESKVARMAALFGGVALVLAATPFLRLPVAVAEFAGATRGLSAVPPHPLRHTPINAADLFRGIPIGPTREQRGILFGTPGGVRLTLDVYQPVQHGRYPIVVQIYGGAWRGGDPSSNANFAKWLASSGYVVFAVDYRHAPRWKWPTQLDDVDSSLVWIRDHAAEYEGDTARVVLIGRSAGAHLAMLAAYRSPPIGVRGVVSYYGPAFLADAYVYPPHPDPLDIRSVDVAFLGGPPDAMPERYADASPPTYLDHAQPPTLLIQGGRDHIVEAKYGPQLRDRLRASHTPVAYLEIPWAEHAFDAVFNGPSSQLALFYTERFVAWAVR